MKKILLTLFVLSILFCAGCTRQNAGLASTDSTAAVLPAQTASGPSSEAGPELQAAAEDSDGSAGVVEIKEKNVHSAV